MKPIISAGAVIFRREQSGELKFLLLYHGKGYWNFPKGKLEQGEEVSSAFLREVEEETGLHRANLNIISGFREKDTYVMGPRKSIGKPNHAFKIVHVYLAETREEKIRVSFEHEGYGWFRLPDALAIVRYENTKRILKHAHDFIRKNLPGAATRAQQAKRR